MSVNVLPSDGALRRSAAARQRAVGHVTFSAEQIDGLTRPVRIAESGSMRIRLPRGAERGIEAVLVNTAGGIACGDTFAIEIDAQTETYITVTTPAAERVYRSDGPVAEVSTSLSVGEGARLDWLPQETILFDRARLSRRLDVEMVQSATLSIFEAVVFGRAARAETIAAGSFADRWRIRRGGKVVYADTLKLEGAIDEIMQRASVAKGARALATFLYVGPDAQARLGHARDCLVAVAGCEAAASAWNGLLVVRFCAVTIELLRFAASRFLIGFRDAPLPRVWSS